MEGLGVVMGPLALVGDELREGRLVAPIKEAHSRDAGVFCLCARDEQRSSCGYHAMSVAGQRRQLGGSRTCNLSLRDHVWLVR